MEEITNPTAVGIDIGATFTKLALVDCRGNTLLQEVAKTPTGSYRVDGFLQWLFENTRSFLDKAEDITGSVAGIGFSVPCYVTGDEWKLLNICNLSYLEGVSIHRDLENEFGPRIAMMNDVSAAGIAEYRFGMGRNYDRMLFMGIGTGISSSFVTKGTGLVHFVWDTIGDTGHIIVDPLGSEPCPCGARGCLESIAAGPAIRTKAIREIQQGRQTMLSTIMETKGDLDAKDVTEAAEQGDQAALEIMERVGTAIGIAMTSLIHIFCPDVIVIGGGVSLSWNLIKEPISRTIHSMAGSWYQQQLKAIEVSRLGVNAGAIGSACLILFPEYQIDQSNPLLGGK